MAEYNDVLIFAEDPGAANYLADIPAQLKDRGLRCVVLASGLAIEQFRQRGTLIQSLTNRDEAQSIFEALSPRLVVIGTSEDADSKGLELVAESRTHGVESVGVVDAFTNANYRFKGRTDDPLKWAPNWLVVPDERTRDVYIALGYLGERVVACGHPHFDYIQSVVGRYSKLDREELRRRLFPGLTRDSKVVIFGAEVSTGLDPSEFQYSPEYTLIGRGTSTGRTEIVIEEFLDNVNKGSIDPYLVLRLHPKNTSSEYAAYLHEFDKVSEGGSPLEEIYAADLVVGMTSILLAEAALMGTSTLSIVPRDSEKSWLPDLILGVTRIATSTKEIKEHLFKLLCGAPMDPIPCLYDHIPTKSSTQVADFIESLCRPRSY